MEEDIEYLRNTERELKSVIGKINFNEMDFLSYNQIAPIIYDMCIHILRPWQLENIRNLSKKQPVSLKDKIEQTEQDLSDIKGKLAGQKELYGELLEKEEELNSMEQQYNSFTKRIKRLQDLEKLVGDLDLKTPEEKLDQLEQMLVNGLPNLKEKLGRLCVLLEKEEHSIFQQTRENAQKLQMLSKKLQENVLSLNGELKNGLDNIQSALPIFEKKYNDLVEQFNLYYKKLKQCAAQIKEIDEVHAKNVKVYEKHFAENQMIWGRLEKPPKALEYVEELVSEMEVKLKTFDTELKKLIVKKQHSWPESYSNGK